MVIITYLEMNSAADFRAKPAADARFRVCEATVPQWQYNKLLYFIVGADWGWTDKRPWSDAQWREHVESGHLRTFTAYYDGAPAGYYEFLPDENGGVEIAILGLLPPFIGRGLGAALLTDAIEKAWSLGAARVWLHTDTLDHPAALPNYQARGMRIWKIEHAGGDNA
jgi:GNAT superfamily N-acetyltransferase